MKRDEETQTGFAIRMMRNEIREQVAREIALIPVPWGNEKYQYGFEMGRDEAIRAVREGIDVD